MKILSLVFKRDTLYKNPTILERLEIIDSVLSENKDTNILVCSEAFLARINNNNNKFTTIDKIKINLENISHESDKITYCEQQKIINSNDCESEETLLFKLKEISRKYSKTLIVPGTTFVKSYQINNRTYLILNGLIIKKHNKIQTFTGFGNDFDYNSYDCLSNNESCIKNIKFEHQNYNVNVSICADVCPVENRELGKLSIFLAPSYGLPSPTIPSEINIITENIDIYIQPDGSDLQTYIVKNPSFLGDFTIIEKSLNKFENIIKCFEINITQTSEQQAKQIVELAKIKEQQKIELENLGEKIRKNFTERALERAARKTSTPEASSRKVQVAVEAPAQVAVEAPAQVAVSEAVLVPDKFELKYLKYKTKYIKLKNKI